MGGRVESLCVSGVGCLGWNWIGILFVGNSWKLVCMLEWLGGRVWSGNFVLVVGWVFFVIGWNGMLVVVGYVVLVGYCGS